jgi:DNA-binding MarR family transcriptional regulator
MVNIMGTGAFLRKERRLSNKDNAEHLFQVLQETIIALVKKDSHDLSSRQLGCMLICYQSDGPHTVRGLASKLNVSKPAITRAIDKLSEQDLVQRKPDPSDRRSVLVGRTTKGNAFIREIRSIILQAERRASAPQSAVSKQEAANHKQEAPNHKHGASKSARGAAKPKATKPAKATKPSKATKRSRPVKKQSAQELRAI